MKSLLHFCSGVLLLLLVFWPPSAVVAEERLDVPPANTFSIVLIPDTQAYSGVGTKSNPEDPSPVTNKIFVAHTDWIVRNQQRQNIVFASHVGDIVDINEDRQWEVARACMDALHGRLPYGISVGNHDMTSRGDSSLFQKYFGAERFREFPWYGGCFPGTNGVGSEVSANNANSFQLFEAGGGKWIFLHLECNAPDDVLEWANETLRKYSDRQVFITSHMGWGPLESPSNNAEFITAPKGRMRWKKIHGVRGNTPQQMWDKCYRHHPNLVAVFSGDQSRTQAYKASNPGDHGNIIHELLQDYGSGWLRLYRFVPQEKKIQAITFDPNTEILCEGTKLVPSLEEHQFELPFAP